uniref:MBD domain-containing protein n=1 Tax=Strigamia maritima TaxID=126957 RepID=T1IHB9_STRMM
MSSATSKSLQMTYTKGDSPLDISNGSETHSFNLNESSDDSDNDSSSPVPVEAPIFPPAASLTTQALSGVTTRKKPTQPVPIPPFKPRSKVDRTPVLGKSGWIREQVQRQSGATAGQWDVYFYPPGQQVKLRSRPEVKEYCENELNEPYVAADYDWKPSQKPLDTVVQEPSTEQAVVEPQGATDESDNNGTSEDSYETYAVLSVGTTLAECKDAETDTEFPFRNLVGSLMFLATRTRPDILYSTIFLSQFNNKHSLKHVKCLMQVLQYVVNTKEYCIDLAHCKDEKISLFSDASWATDLVACKSFGGYFVFIGGTVVSWGCKKQSVVACSSMEAEYIALLHAVRESYWIGCMFENCTLFSKINTPIMHSDSLSSIQFTTNDVENTKTKHIRIRYHFLRDWFKHEYFKLMKVPGKWNAAYIFTKRLSGEQIKLLCSSVFGCAQDNLRVSVINLDVHSHPESYFI